MEALCVYLYFINFQVDFGSLFFPDSFDVPAEANAGTFSTEAHGVQSGAVTVLDKRRIMIERLFYDGAGPG